MSCNCVLCDILLYSAILSIFALVLYFIPIVKFILQIKKKVAYKEPDLSCKLSSSHEILHPSPDTVIDVVLIGSGLGSLVTGALLAKQGRRVIVLEQHNVAGGSCHSFKACNGSYCFESGFHYIGNQNDYLQILGLALSRDISWHEIKQYDLLRFAGDGQEFVFEAPQSALIASLQKQFPAEKTQIAKYAQKALRAFKCTQILTLANFWLSGKALDIATFIVGQLLYRDVYRKTSLQVCKELGISQNQKLMSLLFGQFVNYGLPPSQSPFAVGSGTPLTHFVNGAIYPKDKPEAIVKSIVSTIEQCGGKVFVSAAVENILINNKGEACGVALANGAVINAKKVISGIGLSETVALLPERMRWKVPSEFRPGVSHFVAFVGIDKDIHAPAHNLWYFPCKSTDDLEKEVQQYKSTLDLEKMYMFISFPTGKARGQQSSPHKQKDSIVSSQQQQQQQKQQQQQAPLKENVKQSNNNDNKTSCIMLAEATWEMVEKYKESSVRRKEGYKEFKQKILDHMLKKLQEQYPETKGHIEFSELGTPLSIEHYLGRFASCGYALDTNRFLHPQAGPKTPVKGLFLTGQDSFYPGICGAIVSGFFCALQVNRPFN